MIKIYMATFDRGERKVPSGRDKGRVKTEGLAENTTAAGREAPSNCLPVRRGTAFSRIDYGSSAFIIVGVEHCFSLSFSKRQFFGSALPMRPDTRQWEHYNGAGCEFRERQLA